MNNVLIRLEGLMVLAAASYFYFTNGYSWWVFLLLLFAPDIFMLGYAVNKKIGAYVYNLGHIYITPVLLLVAGWSLSSDVLTMISFIWIAHIGLDRLVGYGLKYETDFKHSHIQRI